MSKLYLYLGGLIAIALAFGTYTYHERAIGAAKEIAALKVSSDHSPSSPGRGAARAS